MVRDLTGQKKNFVCCFHIMFCDEVISHINAFQQKQRQTQSHQQPVKNIDYIFLWPKEETVKSYFARDNFVTRVLNWKTGAKDQLIE